LTKEFCEKFSRHKPSLGTCALQDAASMISVSHVVLWNKGNFLSITPNLIPFSEIVVSKSLFEEKVRPREDLELISSYERFLF